MKLNFNLAVAVLSFTSITSTALAVDRLVPSEYATIQAAVDAAQSGDTILILAGVYSAPVAVNGKSLTFVGAGTSSTFLDGLSTTYLLAITSVPSPGVILRDITFRNGHSDVDGAGLRIQNSRVTLTRCAVVDCVAERDIGCAWCNVGGFQGGGLLISSGSHVTLRDTLVSRNKVRQSFWAWGAAGEIRGAGIFVSGALLELDRVTCRANTLVGNDYPPPSNNNDVRGFGAGICARDNAVVSIKDSWLESNEILGDRCDAGHGGAVYGQDSTLSILRTSIQVNVLRTPHGTNEGGGIWSGGGTCAVSDSDLWLNFASSSSTVVPGAALFASSGSVEIELTNICGSGSMPIAGVWTDLGGTEFSNFCFDCNANGILDSDEIASGSAIDSNGSGVPDECECLGDISGNGSINGVDLAGIFAAWGTDGQNEFDCDIDNDGIVGGTDLAFILVGWGPCAN